jgi:group I intron endonuclease
MAQSGIYGIEYNGRIVYVGQSVNIQVRFGQHRCSLRNGIHRNFVLQRIYDKHPDSLVFITLEEVSDREALTAAEQAWMNHLKPATNLATASGSHPHTDETKAKMRAHQRSEEHRRRLSEAHRGKTSPNKGKVGVFHHTEEAKAKIAAASRGRSISDEERLARSFAQRGRVFSPEHREKLRQAKLGKPNEAVRKAMTGRKQSPELVAKRVASFNAAIARRKEGATDASE